MKKIFILILLIFLMGSCRYHKPYHQDFPKTHPKVRYYDNKGKYKGYWQKTGYGRIRYYDKKGRYKGYSIRSNYGKVRYYDERGRFVGNSQ